MSKRFQIYYFNRPLLICFTIQWNDIISVILLIVFNYIINESAVDKPQELFTADIHR